MLRISDILVRIRIRGSVPLTNGSGSGFGPCNFRQRFSTWQLKTIFFYVFFCLLLFEATFTRTSFFKDFCLMIEGSESDFGIHGKETKIFDLELAILSIINK